MNKKFLKELIKALETAILHHLTTTHRSGDAETLWRILLGATDMLKILKEKEEMKKGVKE